MIINFQLINLVNLQNILIEQKIVQNFISHMPVLLKLLNRAHSKNYINDIKNKTLDKMELKKLVFH